MRRCALYCGGHFWLRKWVLFATCFFNEGTMGEWRQRVISSGPRIEARGVAWFRRRLPDHGVVNELKTFSGQFSSCQRFLIGAYYDTRGSLVFFPTCFFFVLFFFLRRLNSKMETTEKRPTIATLLFGFACWNHATWQQLASVTIWKASKLEAGSLLIN